VDAFATPDRAALFSRYRGEFPILETCTYLVSHSLGAMPRAAAHYLQQFASEWQRRGVRAWREGWWDLGRETGNLLAPILGVAPGTISMHQNVTVAQGIIASGYAYEGRRRKVVLSELDFPSNLYLFAGLRRFGAEVVIVPEEDPLTMDLERFIDAIDERTALVSFSYVLFRSAALQNATAIVDKARRVGAHVVADVYQAAGTLPLQLGALGVEYGVGGSVKWLCGGPGAGYLYVRPDHAPTVRPAFAGWAAHARPFAFELDLEYAAGPERFQSGTPNVPALYSARAGYEIINEVGVEAIRARSLELTGRIIAHAEARGYSLHTPRGEAHRGGTVVVDVPGAEGVAEDLVRREIVVDHRPGAGIRIAPHFYTTEAEIDHAMTVLDEIVAARAPGRAPLVPPPASR
jgi:kynureninase